MSKTYTETVAHALILANDPNFDTTQLAALFDEMYQRYWKMFLKDRVKFLASFITFSQDNYVKATTVAAREILNLTSATTATGTLGEPRLGMTRDEFEAVCSDAEALAESGTPIRWGAIKNQGDDYWRIAIFPATEAVVSFSADILPAYTTPSGSTALEGDDVDAFNVARLTAVEVMIRNGDDSNDIQAVWAPLDDAIKEKFAYMMERARPNERPQKEQV